MSLKIGLSGRWTVIFCLGMISSGLAQTDPGERYWPRFRGPNGLGIAVGSDLPVHFNAGSNVVWEVAVPAGHSSPCIWGEFIFLTGVAEGKLITFCLDRATGKEIWRQTAPASIVEKVSNLGSPAASTPTTDGQFLYIYFGSYGLLAYDFQGKLLWQKPLPTPITQHGASSSPIIVGDKLIQNCDQDVDSYLMAVDRFSGKTAWRTERPEFRRGFSTPFLWRTATEESIVVAGTLRVAGYSPKDGAEKWSVSGLPNEMCASPVAGDGLLFVGGWTSGTGPGKLPSFQSLLDQGDKDQDGKLARAEAPPGPAQQQFLYIDANKDGILTREEWDSIATIFARSKNQLLAIRPGGQGDATETHVLWKQTRGLPYVPSPLYYHGRIYVVKNGGIVSCFNATNGAPCFQEERLGALGDYYSSPVAAGNKVCFCSQNGTVTIIAAGDTLEVLARNAMAEPILATPAIVENIIYLRTTKHLFAFGNKN